MKYLYTFLLLLTINNNVQSMQPNEKTPLLNQQNISKQSMDSIHEQLHQYQSTENNNTEQSFIDQIISENNTTMCSPSIHDVCQPKKLVAKTAITLCLAGILDGCVNGFYALMLISGSMSPSLLCTPPIQICFASGSCCVCWTRNTCGVIMSNQ